MNSLLDHVQRLRRLAGIFIALAFLLASCGDDDSDDNATASDTESTVAEPAEPAEPADGASDEASSETGDAAAVDDEDPLPVGGSDLGDFEPFADGTYTMDQLGVAVTFTVAGEWSTQPVGPGFFVITTPDSFGPGDHDIVAIAPTQLFDAAREPSLPVDDLAGWLDGVPATATVSDSTAGEIGGFTAKVFTIDVGEETPCVEGDRGCVDFALVGDVFGKSFDRGFMYEVHWVEHPDGPISFVIGTPSDDLAWLDTARAVVGTIELG